MKLALNARLKLPETEEPEKAPLTAIFVVYSAEGQDEDPQVKLPSPAIVQFWYVNTVAEVLPQLQLIEYSSMTSPDTVNEMSRP